MNLIYIVIIFLLFTNYNSTLEAQTVTIPDSVFKAKLLENTSINTNGDSLIQISEAQLFSGTIDVSGSPIYDLTGIEEFTALTRLICRFTFLTSLDISNNSALVLLDCKKNQLTNLDVSKNTALTSLTCQLNQIHSLDLSENTALTYLNCVENLLTNLDLSENTALEELFCDINNITALNISSSTELKKLWCTHNRLTELDVSNNPQLTIISCWINQLTSLDVSNNPQLGGLYCDFNQITMLDISINNPILHQLSCYHNQLICLNIKNGNNTNFDFFKASLNPNLNCIEVDDVAYSISNWPYSAAAYNHDPHVSFSSNCSSSNSKGCKELTSIKLFPNPTTNEFHLNLVHFYPNPAVEIRNTLGQLVFSQSYTSVKIIDLELKGQSGLYFVKIRTKKEEVLFKVVKI